jgi:hypothetical protein
VNRQTIFTNLPCWEGFTESVTVIGLMRPIRQSNERPVL